MADVEKKVIEAIREYFQCRDKKKLLASLDAEYGATGGKSSSQLNKHGKELLSLFASGSGPPFLASWEKNLPSAVLEKDRTCRRLEFGWQVHFAVYHLRRGSSPQSAECRSAMEIFKKFLENRGQLMGEFEEYSTFFALPYVPDAKKHKPFEHVFKDGWVVDLKTRLDAFLKSVLKEQHLPLLVKILQSGTSGSSSNGASSNGASKNGGGNTAVAGAALGGKETENLRLQLTECEERALLYIRRFNESQASYQSLLGVARDLVGTLQESVAGTPVSPQEIEQLCSRLAGSSLDRALDFSRPGSAVGALQSTITDMRTPKLQASQQQAAPLPSLDYNKIKTRLPQLSPKQAALLFQALRLRLTQSIDGYQRDCVISAYVEADILGCARPGKHRDAIQRALTSSKPELQESTMRLLNALASTAAGRKYIDRHPSLVQVLKDILDNAERESGTMRSLVAALQKLSLLKAQQTQMIKCGMVKWLVASLGDTETMSNHTLHYTGALMMNLCLRTAGKKCCISNAKDVLAVLTDHLEGDDDLLIRSYINGSLYSLLAVPQIREQAKEMGIGVVVEGLQKASPPHMASQLGYILKQLNSDERFVDNGDSDDESDDEEEEEPDNLDDADRGDVLTADPGQSCGEDLLCRDYLAISSKAQRNRPRTGLTVQQASQMDRPIDRPVTPRHPHLLAEATPPPQSARSTARKTTKTAENAGKENRKAAAGHESQRKQAPQQQQQQQQQQQSKMQPPKSQTQRSTADRSSSERPTSSFTLGSRQPTTSHGRPMTSSGAKPTPKSQNGSDSPPAANGRQNHDAESAAGSAPRMQAGRGLGRGSSRPGAHPLDAAPRKPGSTVAGPGPQQGMTTTTDPNSRTTRISFSPLPTAQTSGAASTSNMSVDSRAPEQQSVRPTASAAPPEAPRPEDYTSAFSSRPRLARTPDKPDRTSSAASQQSSPLSAPAAGSSGGSSSSPQFHQRQEPAVPQTSVASPGYPYDEEAPLAGSSTHLPVSPAYSSGYEGDSRAGSSMSSYSGFESTELPNLQVTVSGKGRQAAVMSQEDAFYAASPPPPDTGRTNVLAAEPDQGKPASSSSTPPSRSNSRQRQNKASNASTTSSGTGSTKGQPRSSDSSTGAPRRSNRTRKAPG